MRGGGACISPASCALRYEALETGKYKTSAGFSACTMCEVGKYKVLEGGGECSRCPTYSVSPAGSGNKEDCRCRPGFSGPNGGGCISIAAIIGGSVAGLLLLFMSVVYFRRWGRRQKSAHLPADLPAASELTLSVWPPTSPYVLPSSQGHSARVYGCIRVFNVCM